MVVIVGVIIVVDAACIIVVDAACIMRARRRVHADEARRLLRPRPPLSKLDRTCVNWDIVVSIAFMSCANRTPKRLPFVRHRVSVGCSAARVMPSIKYRA